VLDRLERHHDVNRFICQRKLITSAEKELDSALAPLLALGQSYPQLNSSNNFLNLQDNLADTETRMTGVLDELELTALVISIPGVSAVGAAAIL
jgi:hypothetical protein